MRRYFLACLIPTLLLATPALADERKADQSTVTERRALMASISADFIALGKALRGGGDIRRYALPFVRSLEAKAALIPDLFPENSGRSSGLKTRASDRIWQDVGKFRQDAAALGKAMSEMAGIIETGSRPIALERYRKLGRETCGSCHTVGSPKREVAQ
jgi:cytochrome c556